MSKYLEQILIKSFFFQAAKPEPQNNYTNYTSLLLIERVNSAPTCCFTSLLCPQEAENGEEHIAPL